MKKRCMSIMLAIALALTNILPTFAATPAVEREATLKSTEAEYIENNYISYTLKIETIFYKGIMPSEKVLDFPVDCNTLTGSVNL